MTTVTSTQTASQVSSNTDTQLSRLRENVQALAQTFAAALFESLGNPKSPDVATSGNTATEARDSAGMATGGPATTTLVPDKGGTVWRAPWLTEIEHSERYLHNANANHETRQQGKPNVAEFMQATGSDASTASQLLYGVVSGATDFRNWDAIMSSNDPVLAARQATGALYNSDLPYSDGQGIKPSASEIIAAEGNFAWLKIDNRESLWLMDKQGEALRQVAMSAPEILRATRDYGLNPADLAPLADQMDARQVRYAPGALYPGSDGGVDLRNLAQGGLGAAYDWTSDPLAHLKGPGAQDAVAADALMAREMGLQRTPVKLANMSTLPLANTPVASANGLADMDALSSQSTQNLIAQLQNALMGSQTGAGSKQSA